VRLASLVAVTALATCTPAVRTPTPDAAQDAAQDVIAEVPPECAAMAAQTLGQIPVDFYRWDGAGAARQAFDWPLDSRCGRLRASAAWLRVEGDGAARTLVVDPASLASGLHRAELELIDDRAGADATVLARVGVRLRVLRAPRAGAARRVLVVGYDGARPDAVQAARTPILDFLLERAAFTFDARTQLAGPTVSAPGWMSTFTGVDPSRHRVVANGEYGARVAEHRTFVARAIDAGRSAVVSTSWEEVTTSIVERDLVIERQYGLDPFAARWLAGRLRASDAQLFFQHLNDPDAAGHSTGFSAANPAYIRAIESCDANLGVLVDGVLSRPTIADEDWLFVLTTDHGGSGTAHGPLDDDNRRIWFVAAGASLAREPLGEGVSHMDTAPTVLRWLGVTIEPSWGLQGVARVR
jgi:hypothetical protein